MSHSLFVILISVMLSVASSWLNVIMLSVIMLDVVMLSIFMLNNIPQNATVSFWCSECCYAEGRIL